MNTKRGLSALLALCLTFALCACTQQEQLPVPVVKLAIPYEDRLSGISGGYYKAWLEEQAGVRIEFTFIPQTYAGEYLNLLLTGRAHGVDGVLFSAESAVTPEVLADYGARGAVLPLEAYMDEPGGYLRQVFDEFASYDLQRAITASDGHRYYMPALDTSRSRMYAQTLWVNIGWLETLGLSLPATTQELRETLRAFQMAYPEAAPLIGSAQREDTFPCNFLMNSFTICDPDCGYLAAQDGKVFFPPATDAWRDGLRYCRSLYAEKLLSTESCTFTAHQLIGLVNDPRNLAGAFPSNSLSDIIYERSPELLSQYLMLAPLDGPSREGVAVKKLKLPRVGGVVLSGSQQPETVFRLLDLMCSEDAFLIGHYGQPGVDWDTAEVGDISIFGEPATIAIQNTDQLQRDAVTRVVGPFISQEEYVDTVAWKGYQINQSEYVDARALRLYEPYAQKEPMGAALLLLEPGEREMLAELAAAVKDWMLKFVTGEADIESDSDWNAYLTVLEAKGMAQIRNAAERVYGR